ncbi:RHS repeat-associated core domain-containing protein [Novipirellula maiorica]|uniref:RHS repeat-associated core domain-containing protein n=1 Tax=Novipirellula maiorica TaxID=1265734 RepID=UPI001F451F19|nr:RHS repeat-associated core domain-containing protein [Rhodopirellula maiorica]
MAPTDLLGVINDDLPSGVSWTLMLAPADPSLGEWSRKIASGNGLVTTATALGQFDPTMLANGSYRLTLSATDAGGHTSSDSEIVNVDGRLKLGNFSLSFTDLEIPVAGIPITIRRSYDTLSADVIGDFGYGWSLEVVQPTLSVDYSTTGAPSFGPGRSYPTFINGTRVTVVTPDGREEGFTFNWKQVSDGYAGIGKSQSWGPSFIADSGNQYELIAPNNGSLFRRLSDNGPFQDDYGNLYSALSPYFGGAFQLKEVGPGTRGLNYTISAETMTGTRVADKYGNALRFSDDGINAVTVDANGNETDRNRGVTFDRDWLGRITTITDPAGESLTYKYDSAGRLINFYDRRATDRLNDSDPLNDYQPTKFQYTLGNDPAFETIPGVQNYLTRIIDPLGTTAIQANYDSVSGRLISLVDADGNPASLDYDIEGLKVTSTSSSGSTEVSVDNFGNPIRSVDEQGNIMLTEYADPQKGLPSKVTRVVGDPDTPAEVAAGIGDDLTTRYSYNQWGQKTSETDPRGNTTSTIYDSQGYPRQEIDVFGNATTYSFWEGQLYGTSDADGNSTSFSYDAFGNVSGMTQSNPAAGTSTSTSFVYNTYGDLVSTTDADNNTRTIAYDNLGRQTGTSFVWNDPLGILPNQTLTTSVNMGPDGNVDSSTDAQGQTSITLYDALGRAYQQIDANGRVSETVYDKRGLAIETRSEGVDELGNVVQMVSRTVYDTSGRAIYSTGSFPIGTDPSQITGTHTIYDAEGRVEKSEQLLGVDIELVGQASNLSSVLASAGSVISFSSSVYDDAGRVVETYSDTGLRSQTLYGQFGEVVESRNEVPPASGESPSAGHWMVSRTIYDSLGRAVISTDRFKVPLDTPLGEDPISGPVPTQITKTIYDTRGRTTATEQYTGATVSLTQLNTPTLPYSPAPILASSGTLDSVSETLYDAAGRVWRTISARVPLSTLSGVALSQAEALEDYPVHGSGTDPYANFDPANYGLQTGDSLSPGIISDSLFDTRGRQYASLGQPLPAAGVGLDLTLSPFTLPSSNFLVRPRTETIYDSLGQASVQRSGLAQVESTTGVFQSVYDADAVDTKTYTDALGNVYRSEFITGGTVSYNSTEKRTERVGASVHSYTLTRFDSENRPVAEMQQTAGAVTAVWSETENSFVIDGTSTPIPTKLYVYDADYRLVAVELPAVANPLNSNAVERPRYEYAYNAQGNQTLIRDPLGRETRFSFTDRGQQATRTLPLGFGDDGVFGTGDDPTFTDPYSGSPLPLSGDGPGGRAGAPNTFTEGFTYDERGRQRLHVSFEGVVSENIYDDFGRLTFVNYYADQTALAGNTISERWGYEYDSYGRKSAAIHSVNSGGSFTVDRVEETFYDERGRVIAESSPEGVLGYSYDAQGRLSSTAVFAAGDDFEIDDPERVTSYRYDLLGRLVSVQEDSTPVNTSDDPQLQTDYAFDLAGRMDTTTISDPSSGESVTSDYDYDSLGRLDTQTDTDENSNVLADYDYTVRVDGKRTALDETFWFDADDDGVVDAGEQKTTSYDWTYDEVGRLTDEVIDHWDNNFDQTESFTYDLTGNRIQLDRDHGNNGVDQVITYDYDANDRLFNEILDDLTATNADTTTTYGYDHTQQTSKTVTANSVTISVQHFAYNLQGRMSAVVNEGYTSGTLSSRERTSYGYDSKSYRVSTVTETGTASGTIAGETWTLQSSTEFLADSHNHTGYTQIIRETKVENGHTLITDYTFGSDEISQRVHGAKADGTPVDETLVFGHDGHGSVRVLYDIAATGANLIEQILTFAAYGSMLAVHNATGTLLGTNESFAKTSLGYSGEHFDAKAQQQYLRARFYNPTNGQFNRLDPFAGNTQDPQSLHKYAYVHGDPIGNVDPTGEFSLGGMLASIAIGFGQVAQELTSGALIIGLLETGGKAGFAARDAGLLMIAEGRFDVGFMLFNLGSRIAKLTLDVIDIVDTAIGFLTLGAAATIAGYALVKHGPELADNLFSLAKNFRSKRKPGQVNLGLCFASDTVVTTAEGKKAICDIAVGERVLSYDFGSSGWSYNSVTNTSASQYTGKRVKLSVGETHIECTAYHPFWVVAGEDLASRPVPRELCKGEDEGLGTVGRWVNSHDLRVGDQVMSPSGEISTIEIVEVNDVENFSVCNLTVEKTHVYTVGNSQVVVHNTSGSSIGGQFPSFGSSRLRPNQLPDSLADELATASANGVSPIKVGDPGFDEVVNSGTVKWAVDEAGDLWVIPAVKNGEEISHAVLVGGRPVKAAGQADVAGTPGTYLGLDITPHSGHYNNGASAADNAETVAIGIEAFGKTGITF